MRTVKSVLLGSLLAATVLVIATPANAGKWGERSPLGKRALGPGMRGKDVRLLQAGLTRLDIPTAKTGRFGRGTYRSVRKLEHRAGWPADGRVSRKEGKRIKKRVRARLRQPLTIGPYVFPLGDPHDFGGEGSKFGAPRPGGRSHQGQDIAAPCGVAVYSAHTGLVKTNAYQAAGAGYYVVVDGADGTDTVYMHLQHPSPVAVGSPVGAGTQIGSNGASGSASGCHLHFEHWTAPGWYTGGAPIDPLPELLYWDTYS